MDVKVKLRRKMEIRKQREGGQGKAIVSTVLIAVAIGGLLTAGLGAILYRRGVAAGREEVFEQSRGAIEEIAKVVEEKDRLEEELEGLDGAELAEYEEKLAKISPEIEDEIIKKTLEELLGEVREYRKVAEGGDGVASAYELEELREKITEASSKVHERFRARLESAVEKIGE